MEPGSAAPVVNSQFNMQPEDICNHLDQVTPEKGMPQPEVGISSPVATGRAPKIGAASARSWLAAMSQSHDDFASLIRAGPPPAANVEVHVTPRQQFPAVRSPGAFRSPAALGPTLQPDQSRFEEWLQQTTPYMDSATRSAEDDDEVSDDDDEGSSGAAAAPADFNTWLNNTEVSPSSDYSNASAATPYDVVSYMAPTSTVLRPKPLYDVGDDFSSDEDGTGATPYIAADAASTPPTATFSASSVEKLNARMAHMALAEQLEGGGTPVAQKTAAFGRLAAAADAACTPYAGRTPANTPFNAEPEGMLPPKSPLEKVLHMMAAPAADREDQAQLSSPASFALGAQEEEEEQLCGGYDSSSDDEVTDPELIELLQRSTGKVLAVRPARTPMDKVIHMMVDAEVVP